MRIGNSTRSVVKQQIMDVLVKDFYQTTFKIMKKVGRSWEFTNELLLELEKEGKVEMVPQENIMAWRRKNGNSNNKRDYLPER